MPLVFCSVVALLVANHSVEPETASASPWQETINIASLTGADVQIQRIEHDKTQTLGELEPALRHQMQLQVYFVNLVFTCLIFFCCCKQQGHAVCNDMPQTVVSKERLQSPCSFCNALVMRRLQAAANAPYMT